MGSAAFKPLSQGSLPLSVLSGQQTTANGSTAAASRRSTATPPANVAAIQLAPSLRTSAAGAAIQLAASSRRSTADAAPSAAFDEGQLMLSSMAEMEREDELHDAHELRNRHYSHGTDNSEDDEDGGPPPVDVTDSGSDNLCFTAQLEGADADEDGVLALGWMRLVQVAELEAGSQRATAEAEAMAAPMHQSSGGGQGATAVPDSLPAALRAVLTQLAGSIPTLHRAGQPRYSQPGTGPAVPHSLSNNGAWGAAAWKVQAGHRVAAASMPGGMAREAPAATKPPRLSATSTKDGSLLSSAVPTCSAALPVRHEEDAEPLSESSSWYTSTVTTGSRASVQGSSSGGGFGGSSSGGNSTAPTRGSRPAGGLVGSKDGSHLSSLRRDLGTHSSAVGSGHGRESSTGAGNRSGTRRASILAPPPVTTAEAGEGPLTSLLRSLGLSVEDVPEEPAVAISEPRAPGQAVSEPGHRPGGFVSELGSRASKHGTDVGSPAKMRVAPAVSAPGSAPEPFSSPATQQKPRPAAAATGSPTKSRAASAPGFVPEATYFSTPQQQGQQRVARTSQELQEPPYMNTASVLMAELEGLCSGAASVLPSDELLGLREALLCALPVWRLSQELGGGSGGKQPQSHASHSSPNQRAAAATVRSSRCICQEVLACAVLRCRAGGCVRHCPWPMCSCPLRQPSPERPLDPQARQ